MVLMLLWSGCIFVRLFLRLAWIQGWYSIKLMCKTCSQCGAVNLHAVWTEGEVADYLACAAELGVNKAFEAVTVPIILQKMRSKVNPCVEFSPRSALLVTVAAQTAAADWLHSVYITITLLSFQQPICLGIVRAWGYKEFHKVLIPQLKCVCLLLSHLVCSQYDWHNQTCLIGASHLINQSHCIITCGSLE